MCRTDLWRRSAALAPLALAMTLAAAVAQTNFDDSSFATDNASEAESTTPSGAWPAAPDGGFGGSFDTPAAEPQEGGFGGSFDTPPAETEENATTTAEETVAEEPAREEPVREEQVAEEPDSEPDAPEMAEEDANEPDEPEEYDPIYAFEMRDYGVPPTEWLRQGAFHAATPVELPGGVLITTKGVADAVEDSGLNFVLIDVLGGDYMLPNALMAAALAAPGTFNDRTQQQASVWLSQITGGDFDMPIVLYCSDPMCWMSYNAALRTIAAGYTNVYWYRGGLQAWQMAGLPVFPSGF